MSKVENAVQWAINIANDDSHGYDQIERWGVDFDCSSLVISAFQQAGIPVKDAGATYTGNMLSAFKKCGFVEIPIESRKRGDVLLNKKSHTALCISHEEIVQASINEKGTISGGKKGDQTGREISVRPYYVYSKGWDVCLRYPEEEEQQQESAKTYTVVKGDTLTKIAKKFGTTVNFLVGLNNIEDKNLIRVGQVLKLPASAKTEEPKAETKPTGFKPYKCFTTAPLNIRLTPNGQIVGIYKHPNTEIEVLEENEDKTWGRTDIAWVCLRYTRR